MFIRRKLPNKDIRKLCRSLSVTQEGLAYLNRVRAANKPSRLSNGKFQSVHDTIASRKNRWTTNSEAMSTELPFLLECEFNSSVLEFYDQPEPIKISYRNAKGKLVSHLITPDWLVIALDGIYFVECKKVVELEKLIKEKPQKFTRSGESYSYKPAEVSASEYGFQYFIRTDRDYPPKFTRNCIFLFNFIDDYIDSESTYGEAVLQTIKAVGNRMRLNHLYELFSQQKIIFSILEGYIHVDLEHELLCEPTRTWVYSDKVYLDIFRELVGKHNLVAISSLSHLEEGDRIWWRNHEWDILMHSKGCDGSLTIQRNKKIVTIDGQQLIDLITRQEIYLSDKTHDDLEEVRSILSSKRAYQVEEAINRLAIINSSDSTNVSERSIRRWKRQMDEVKSNGQDPILGVVSNRDKSGNRKPRFSSIHLELMDEYFNTLMQPSPPSVYSVYGDFREACKQASIEPCSPKTFYERFNRIDKRKRVLKQKGFKAAYALGPQPREIDLNWDLPYHGDFIFEVAHVDHTPLEITLVSKLDGEPISTPLNLSLLIDGHSRVILAFYLTFEKPSYRNTMMLLRECYKRHQRLPIFLASDRGPDFEGHYLNRTLARLKINKRRRPSAASRHGSVIERTFHTTESELIHKLAGNKQLQKLGRGQSLTHKPEKFATWSPDEFYELFEDYVYHQYPITIRRGIAEKPKDRFARSLATFDECPGIKIESEAMFYLSTLPQVDRDGKRMLSKNQIVYKDMSYLLSVKVAGYDGEKIRVAVRYDPYDLSYIWACVKETWVRLSTNDVLVRECLDKGIRLPHLEVIPRRMRYRQSYRKGPEKPLQGVKNIKEREKNLFAQRKSCPPEEVPEKPKQEVKVNISNVKKLNVTVVDKGGREK